MIRSNSVKLDADAQGHYIVALRRHLGYLHHKILSIYNEESIEICLKEYAKTVSLLNRVHTGEINPEDLIELEKFDE